MLEAILLFAATEHGSSKTAFYIAGAALAVWAVLVAAVGIKQHADFPATKGLRNGIVAMTALLVGAVAATSILTA